MVCVANIPIGRLQTAITLRKLNRFFCKFIERENAMKSLELKVNEKIYRKLLWLLSQFSSEDLIIVGKEKEVKEYLDQELQEIDNGNVEFLTVEELEVMLENRIQKHENKNR